MILEYSDLFQILKLEYPNARCTLNFNDDFELLILARLSAQCNDKIVNSVKIRLFETFPDFKSFAESSLTKIENLIKPCGLHKTKAKNIKNMCNVIINKFNSKIPDDIENLMSLPGIGRKTANLLLVEIFGIPKIIVDTHVARVSRRLGLHSQKNVNIIESVLCNKFPKCQWSQLSHMLLAHGKNVCKARKCLCEFCVLAEKCPKNF
ncbi:MAG: endonuclease III [Candidatus Improbicoccus devescovinae]|nr:MAG: endonuclease III [Candidatus Improbicoccus devescovinae]